jgi:hypothetical protein
MPAHRARLGLVRGAAIRRRRHNGELGFRFGEPLDVDVDGRADVAAGARFRQEGIFQNGTLSVWSGADGTRIRSWDGSFMKGLFGHCVVPMPDLSGDGLADVVVSAPSAEFDGVKRGVVMARSPKTGEEIWRHVGLPFENFGWDMAQAADHDGDGKLDLIVGAPGDEAGHIYLLSGKTGTTLRTFAPPEAVGTFGWYVARLDDLDGDGAADLAAGAFQEIQVAASNVGAAYVFSSQSGKQLHHWKGADVGSSFGEIVAGIGDLNGDGRGEVIVTAPRTADPARSRPGDVMIFSGTDGKELRHWTGKQPGELFGRMAVSAGDLDGDGIEDVAIGAPWYRRDASERVGRMELRSGRSGDVLGEFFGDEADCWFGWHIRRAPDPDGKRRPALLISSLRHPVDGKAAVGCWILRAAAVGPRSDSPLLRPPYLFATFCSPSLKVRDHQGRGTSLRRNQGVRSSPLGDRGDLPFRLLPL